MPECSLNPTVTGTGAETKLTAPGVPPFCWLARQFAPAALPQSRSNLTSDGPAPSGVTGHSSSVPKVTLSINRPELLFNFSVPPLLSSGLTNGPNTFEDNPVAAINAAGFRASTM